MPIRLDRFSPFFMKPEELGIKRLRPKPGYYYSYPLGRTELQRLAYFFDFDYADDRDVHSYLGELQDEIGKWWQARAVEDQQQCPHLDALWSADAITLTDTRPAAVKENHRLEGLAARIYWQCDSAQSFPNLQRKFGADVADSTIQAILADCLAQKIMTEMDGQYLSLAVFRNRAEANKTEGPHVYTQIQPAQASHSLLHLV